MDIINREDGFTLVEIMVAMVIFMVIVLTMTAFFLNSYSYLTLAGKRTEIVYQAQQGLEKGSGPLYSDTEDGGDEEGSEEEVERVPVRIDIFGKTIKGTKITVEETYDEEHGREVTYVTFIPDKKAE